MHEKLEIIKNLKDGWNDLNNKHFKKELIEKCQIIIKNLSVEMFIAPTACDSIQFELEKENGEYLECEVFLEKIEIYTEPEKEILILNSKEQIEEMCKYVDWFKNK